MNDNKDGLKVKWAKSERTFRRLDAESLGERMVESWCGPRRHLVSPIPPIFWRQWSRRSKKGRKVQIKTRPRSNKFSAARDEPSGCVRAPLRFAGERSCNWTRGGAEAGAGSTLVCHNATDSRMSLWKFMFSFDVWRPLIISISSDQSSHAVTWHPKNGEQHPCTNFCPPCQYLIIQQTHVRRNVQNLASCSGEKTIFQYRGSGHGAAFRQIKYRFK